MRYGYHIFQIGDIGKTMYAFRPWEDARELFSFSDYTCTYHDRIEADSHREALSELFFRFNMDRPGDFKGHSMSVSDIVVLLGDASPFEDRGERWYYCDDYGWTDITEEVKQWLSLWRGTGMNPATAG